MVWTTRNWSNSSACLWSHIDRTVKFQYTIPFAGLALATATACFAQFSFETGSLKDPIVIPLVFDGRTAGSMTLPAGTKVILLGEAGGRLQIGCRAGMKWVEAAQVERTGRAVIPNSDLPAEIASPQATAPVQQFVCPRRRTAQRASSSLRPSKGLPTGKESVPSTNSTFERQVLAMTNQERTKAGLPALVWDEELARAARYHAADMAAERYFEHDSYDRINGNLKKVGDTFERIARFSSRSRSENIAFGSPTPAEVMQSWMHSPGHKRNILDKKVLRLGVGFIHGYWVQDFGK